MSIEQITAKILKDATEYADNIISAAKKEAEEITAKAGKEAKEIDDVMREKAMRDAALAKHRKNSVAELEARKIRIAAKQTAVANTVVAAIDNLANMESDKYIAFLAKKVAEIGVKEGELILNSRDKAAIGKRLVVAANEALNGGKLILSESTMGAKGGFVLKCGTLEINSSLEIMVNSLKETVTSDIVTALF
jgi:V/A-type H+-transporting ATPase subunit E